MGGYISPLEEKVLSASVCVCMAHRQMDGWKDSALVSRREDTKFISGWRVAKARTLSVHLVMRNESSG